MNPRTDLPQILIQDFTPNTLGGIILQTLELYSKPLNYTPNPKIILKAMELYSKPRDFTPKP